MNDMIATSLSKIRELVDAQTVVGEPISTPSGTTIIPVSKISVGYVTGGLDYNSKKAEVKGGNFGGGGGTGVSVNPVGFLTISSEGKVDMITIGETSSGSIDKVTSLVEKAPDILEKIVAVFKKKKPEEENEAKSENE